MPYVIRIEAEDSSDTVYLAHEMSVTEDTTDLRDAQRFDNIVDVRRFIKQAEVNCLMITLPKLMLWEDMTDSEREESANA